MFREPQKKPRKRGDNASQASGGERPDRTEEYLDWLKAEVLRLRQANVAKSTGSTVPHLRRPAKDTPRRLNRRSE